MGLFCVCLIPALVFGKAKTNTDDHNYTNKSNDPIRDDIIVGGFGWNSYVYVCAVPTFGIIYNTVDHIEIGILVYIR
jgi:hypothetical protein